MRYILLAVAMAAATPASAFDIGPRLPITAASGPDFTVGFGNRARLTDYWCRAGRYVTVDLGLSRKTRLYRASPEPQGQGQGIGFTLDQARSTGDPGITVFDAARDGGMSAGHAASSFCYDLDIRLFGQDDF